MYNNRLPLELDKYISYRIRSNENRSPQKKHIYTPSEIRWKQQLGRRLDIIVLNREAANAGARIFGRVKSKVLCHLLWLKTQKHSK